MAFVRVTDPEQIVQLYLAKVLYFTYPREGPDRAIPCKHTYTEEQIKAEVYSEDQYFWFYVHLED